MAITTVSFSDLKERLNDASRPTPLILDVREPTEWAKGHLSAATSLPMNAVPNALGDIPAGEVWVHCAMGGRAGNVARLLDQNRDDLNIMWVNAPFTSAASCGLQVC